MDSFTHIAIGALIGEASLGKALGKRAMLIGAATQSLPDIDFVAALWLNPADNLLAHRGFTHSILFCLLTAFVFALIINLRQKKLAIKFVTWLIFFAAQLFIHLFIDVMNVYGVGLLEPFNHTRFSLNILFVADPIFSMCAIIAFLSLMITKTTHPSRNIWIKIGLAGCVIYLLAAFAIKYYIYRQINEQFTKSSIQPHRHFSTPTPLNILLWYAVAEKDSGYYIGYRSIFDRGNMDWRFIDKHEDLGGNIASRQDIQNLRRFSQGYYIITKNNQDTIFSDLRFGQTFGWNSPNAPFVFQYNLGDPGSNALALQRGRLANWNKDNVVTTLKRIAGRK